MATYSWKRIQTVGEEVPRTFKKRTISCSSATLFWDSRQLVPLCYTSTTVKHLLLCRHISVSKACEPDGPNKSGQNNCYNKIQTCQRTERNKILRTASSIPNTNHDKLSLDIYFQIGPCQEHVRWTQTVSEITVIERLSKRTGCYSREKPLVVPLLTYTLVSMESPSDSRKWL